MGRVGQTWRPERPTGAGNHGPAEQYLCGASRAGINQQGFALPQAAGERARQIERVVVAGTARDHIAGGGCHIVSGSGDGCTERWRQGVDGNGAGSGQAAVACCICGHSRYGDVALAHGGDVIGSQGVAPHPGVGGQGFGVACTQGEHNCAARLGCTADHSPLLCRVDQVVTADRRHAGGLRRHRVHRDGDAGIWSRLCVARLVRDLRTDGV